MDIVPMANYPLPSKALLASQYVGKNLSDLPTPTVVLDRAIIQKNCLAMLNVCGELGVGFRAHVKSHKVCLPSRSSIKMNAYASAYLGW
jgi:D-serine deaminase-like pyridoxal phosphate-dependent protein